MGAKKSFFTIDVDWVPGSEQGLIGLLDLCSTLRLKSTLFVAGRFAYDYPKILQDAVCQGHEIGTHGWEHGLNLEENFRSTQYNRQKESLYLATKALEEVTHKRPVSFRAPNLWVSETTLRVLEELGYRFDSSVPAKRFDMGLGQVNQFRYFHAPLGAYHPSHQHLAVKGDCPVLEVPPSAFFVPLNMTALRILGLKALFWAVYQIAKRSHYLVFYCHPSEFVSPDNQQFRKGEPARHRKRIGPQNLALLSKFLQFIRNLGYDFERICEAHTCV